MTKKEVEHLKEELPGTVLEGDQYTRGLLEKRETQAFIKTKKNSM